MSSLLRRHQQPLMIVLTVLTILVFVGYWNGPTGMRNRLPHASDDIGKMYGYPLTRTALVHEGNLAKLAYQLKLQLYVDLAQSDELTTQALNDFAVNSLVFKHEADALQIEPMGEAVHNDDGVAEAIKDLPAFQTNGQFDPAKYVVFKSDFLPSLGFTTDDLEELIGEDLRAKKIKDLLHATFTVSPELFRAEYTREFQKIDASAIRFKLSDFTSKIQPSDDDIKKAFEQHLEGYYSDEKRGIEYATFSLSDADKKLTGKDRVTALQNLSNTVENFMQALQADGAKFEDVAAKLKIPLTTVPPFTANVADPKLPSPNTFVEVTFSLTPQSPVSEPFEDQETGSFYIVKLGDVIPKKLLTLAEARPQVVDELKKSRGEELMSEQAHEIRNKIVAGMAAGKSFADAAKAEGQTVVTYPPSSPAEPDHDTPDASLVLYTALQMKDSDTSEFTSTEDGGIIVHIDKREPIDPKKFEADRATMEPRYDAGQVSPVFVEWLRKQHDAANILITANGNGNGSPVPPPPK